MTLLVTGGAGFIGSAIVEAALARGEAVRVLDSLRPDVHGGTPPTDERIEFVHGDVRDTGLVAVREEGQHRFYRLEYTPLEQIEDWLIPFLSIDFDAAELVSQSSGGPLPDQARAVADTVGKVAADATHAVTSAVQAVTRKLRP